jgi:hypothetical protein
MLQRRATRRETRVRELIHPIEIASTENAVKSNKTTGYFAPVATRTGPRSLLASAEEPRIVPESAYQIFQSLIVYVGHQ